MENQRRDQRTSQINAIFCGHDYHSKQKCPPHGKICNDCKGKTHFAQACRSVGMKEKGISSVVIGIINRIINVSETKESGELPTLVVGVTNADNALPKPTEVVADTGHKLLCQGYSILNILV